MLLLENDKNSLQLDISGYQFADFDLLGGALTDDELKELSMPRDYDANWLSVAIKGNCSGTAWQHVSALMLTWEVDALADMLAEIANCEDDEKTAELQLENTCLSFAVQKNAEIFDIVVTLRLQAAPDGETVKMNFTYNADKLCELSEAVRKTAAAFPQR